MVRIGKIRSLHGIHGEVMMEHFLADPAQAKQWEALMLELLPGSYIPFFIEEIQTAGQDSLLVKFEELNDRNAATNIMHKNVFAPPGITPRIQKGHDLDAFLGAALFDQHNRAMGEVKEIFLNGPQVLFSVTNAGKELLIPFAENLLLGYDPASRRLTLQVAEGLADL